MKINLFDNNFSHALPSVGYDACCYRIPKKMQWVRNQMEWKGVTVFTDEFCFSGIVSQVKTDFKIAWLMEPPSIKNLASSIKNIQDQFDFIFSYLPNELLLVKNEKYVWVPFGGAWVETNGDFKKSKMISMIASSKNTAPGHKLRHEIAQKSAGKIDLMGNGYRKIMNKLEGHAEYKFSVVIENERYPKFFSEKLIDCLLCKCVPIYWGAYEMQSEFDYDGILLASNSSEIIELINCANDVLYSKMSQSIERNFLIAEKFSSIDDCIYDAIIKNVYKA